MGLDMRSEEEVRKLSDLLAKITSFIGEYGKEGDRDRDWIYACSVSDTLDWVLGRIGTEDFLGDSYLNLGELMRRVRRIERESGRKFEDYE